MVSTQAECGEGVQKRGYTGQGCRSSQSETGNETPEVGENMKTCFLCIAPLSRQCLEGGDMGASGDR